MVLERAWQRLLRQPVATLTLVLLLYINCTFYIVPPPHGARSSPAISDSGTGDADVVSRPLDAPSAKPRVFVSRAFRSSTRDSDKARERFRFFARHGISTPHRMSNLVVHYGIAVAGKCDEVACTVGSRRDVEQVVRSVAVADARLSDLQLHLAMLLELEAAGAHYDHYIFIGTAADGPFVPAYMPPMWHWTEAFTQRLTRSVGLVGASIVCRVGSNAGPKIEGFAFAMSARTVDIARSHMAQSPQAHATDDNGAEFDVLTEAVVDSGNLIDSLLVAYAKNPLQRLTHCNSLQRPGQSYLGTVLNPLETLFIDAGAVGDDGGIVLKRYKEFMDGYHRPSTCKEDDVMCSYQPKLVDKNKRDDAAPDAQPEEQHP